ncbi:MAG: hydrogenase small subunit [Coriobacteriales bacterium]|jgi:hydrogenase small subunit|nr:hydrogenase small subunit [Coriobacteriales bacterium]
MPSFDSLMESHGVSRRGFMKFCAGVAATLGLSQAMVPKIADAAEQLVIGTTSGVLAPALWLEFASCTGCTESFASATTPDVATVILELISLNYSETLSAGAGWSLEEAMDQTINATKTVRNADGSTSTEPVGYILIIEGALMEGWNDNALVIGGEKSTDLIKKAAKNAVAIICAGDCAVDGGWQAASPNPAGATGVEPYLKKAKAAGQLDYDIPPIINVPCCPANPEHIIAMLVDYLLLNKLPQLNEYNMPSEIFGQTIHDNCPRRGHFENGEFVYEFGSEEESKGYCLYAMGCKGPQTYSNCPLVRWNRKVSWCIEAGAPCIGCAQANPNMADHGWVDLNSPFLNRFKHIGIGNFMFDPTYLAYGVGGLVALALIVHGFGMRAAGRTTGGADFETFRHYDLKHPDHPITDKPLAAEEASHLSADMQDEAIDEELKIAQPQLYDPKAAKKKGAAK